MVVGPLPEAWSTDPKGSSGSGFRVWSFGEFKELRVSGLRV